MHYDVGYYLSQVKLIFPYSRPSSDSLFLCRCIGEFRGEEKKVQIINVTMFPEHAFYEFIMSRHNKVFLFSESSRLNQKQTGCSSELNFQNLNHTIGSEGLKNGIQTASTIHQILSMHYLKPLETCPRYNMDFSFNSLIPLARFFFSFLFSPRLFYMLPLHLGITTLEL